MDEEEVVITAADWAGTYLRAIRDVAEKEVNSFESRETRLKMIYRLSIAALDKIEELENE